MSFGSDMNNLSTLPHWEKVLVVVTHFFFVTTGHKYFFLFCIIYTP